MPEPKIIEGGSLRNLLRALLTWCVTALFALLVATAILSGNELGERSLGYLSSLVSFLAAFAAGIAAARGSASGKLGVGLRLGLALVILLLTTGFLIAGKGLAPSGVLSAVSFTLAGCLAGSVLFGKRGAPKAPGTAGRGVRLKSIHKAR